MAKVSSSRFLPFPSSYCWSLVALSVVALLPAVAWQVPMPVATPTPSATLTSRPILHFETGPKGFVTKAVYSDGRQLGGSADALGAVWSPDGKWFAVVWGYVTLNLQGRAKTIFQTRERILEWPVWSPV